MKPEIKKQIMLHLPYLAFVYLFGKVGQAFRLAQGADLSGKLLHHCAFLGSHRNAQHDIPRSVCHLFTVLSAPNKGLGLSQQAKHSQVLFRECGYTPYACYGISLTTTTAAQPQFGKP